MPSFLKVINRRGDSNSNILELTTELSKIKVLRNGNDISS